MRQLTENQFNQIYWGELLTNHIDTNASFNGKMFETFGKELEFVRDMDKQGRVITIIEGDEDTINDSGEPCPSTYYVTGYHYVNRIGYLITKTPITEEFEVKLDW